MRHTILFLVGVLLCTGISHAQNDTIYLMKSGTVLFKYKVSELDSIIFVRPASGSANTVSDADGNIYNTVTIGTQVWMKENLKTTKYNDGSAIPLVTDNTEWSTLSTPGCCWYNNDINTYANKYGALYNWYTVNTGKLCPSGWHVSTDDDWTNMENHLIANAYNYDGATTGNKIAKSLAIPTGWKTTTQIGTIGNTDYPAKQNAAGFSALPGGDRSINGSYVGATEHALWWTATENSSSSALCRLLIYDLIYDYRSDYNKIYGFSVRCVKN